MGSDIEKPGTDVAATTDATPTSVPLGPKTTMDLSWLPEEERKALPHGLHPRNA